MAGCGSSGDSTAASSESTGTATTGKEAPVHSSSLSKEEFIAQAGAICTKEKTAGLEAMGNYVKQHPGATGQGKVALIGEALQKVFLPSIQRQVDQIRALGAPEGEEQEVEAFLDALQEAVDQASQGTPSGGKFGKAFASSAALAHEYGLTACAYG